MTILFAAFSMLWRPDAGSAEFYARAEPGTSVEQMARSVWPWAKIESRVRGSSTYLVAAQPGSNVDEARERVRKCRGLTVVEPIDDPIDMRSLRSIGIKVADLSRDERDEEREGNEDAAKRERDLVDYLRSYEYFVGARAYPNDTVDWGAYDRAAIQAGRMRRANALGSAKLQQPTTLGQQWSFVGPTNLGVPYTQYFGRMPVNGRFNAVAYDPNNSQVIYAGAAQGGLFKTTDGGSTWTWLSSTWPRLGVNCIAVDPTDGNTLYVGLGDYHGYIGGSVGIMKSTDGGSTWTEIGTGAMGKIGVPRLLIDPTSHMTIVAGTGDVNGYGKLYRSLDGGKNWSIVNSLASAYWPALAASVPVGSKTRFYAVAAGIAEKGGTPVSRVYKSDDHGATWQLLVSPAKTGGVTHWAYAVAASPTQPGNVYLLDSEAARLYASTNQGATWKNISANLPQGNSIAARYNFSQSFYDYHLECGSRTSGSSTTDVLYMGEIDLFESTDNGGSWQTLGGPTYTSIAASHNDQHALAVNPVDPNKAVFANDGGIYTETYDPATKAHSIVSLNKNLGATTFYSLSAHPTDPDTLLGGTQDNATPASMGNLANWRNVGGGDGGGCAINQTNPAIQYASVENFIFYRTTDGWNWAIKSFSPPTGSDPKPFVAPMMLAPSDQTKLYTGTNYLYLWNESTQKWSVHLGKTRLAGPPTSKSKPLIQTIAVAPGDANRIYTGSTDGQLWMTANAGTSWKRLNLGRTVLPNLAIEAISVNPSNPSDILIGYSGSGSAHLWRCLNTSAATLTFANVSSNGISGLPDISLNTIARDFDSPATTWYVGTDVGVYQTTDSGNSWSNAGAPLGLPNVIVTTLVAVPGTRYLNAGTYGRGVWRIYVPVPPLAISSLTLDSTSVRRGHSVMGTVGLTTHAPADGFLVGLSSSDPGPASIPASVTVPEGATTASFVVTTSTAIREPATAVITATALGVTLDQSLQVTVPTLAGIVAFGDYNGPKPPTVGLAFRHPGATIPFATMNVELDGEGNFVARNVPEAPCSVSIQTGSWLRTTLSVDLSESDVLNAGFALINGDADGNNRIDVADLRILVSAFGSIPGDPNWNPAADLNGDGKVDQGDLAIYYKNHGRLGN